jgi:penicillin-binding protein-related factor A (putative recombinase)
MTLRLKGCKMVVEIPTPIKIVRGKPIRSKKVFGDKRAIIPGTGQSVLAEAKATGKEDRLKHSRLKAHQIAALDEHHNLGGLSLLIWVSGYGTYCMKWPIPGFQKGRSIKVAEAPTYEWAGVNEKDYT